MRQGPLWIAEPPLSIGERMSVNDPERSAKVLRSGHRNPSKPPFRLLQQGTASTV